MEKFIDVLVKWGINYIEVWVLDVNLFFVIGISES